MRGKTCDLGGEQGGLAVQSADGAETARDTFDLGLTIDYCLTRMTVGDFFAEAPV